MPYITREDGEHFVIPSYRDVLTAKQKSQLKREILALSQNYGEYITLQRKGAAKYEVAFSPDTGYLLGESIWHYFKRPLDMIYCEAIPNTTEAILVIVKSGSVYLDGSFPLESIPEELVIFLTQENNFEIYIHGDVPISETPVAGKFSFDKNSVKSFQVLEKPIFPTLPLLKIYQLQIVDQVLKAHGIGVFPIKAVVALGVVIGLVWMGYTYISAYKPQLITFKPPPKAVDVYAEYYRELEVPTVDEQMSALVADLTTLLTMPGWTANRYEYAAGGISADVTSGGTSVADLRQWALRNNYAIEIITRGFRVSHSDFLKKQSKTNQIFRVDAVVEELVDRINRVNPGNTFNLGQVVRKPVYKKQKLTLQVRDAAPVMLELIGQQFIGLPVVFDNAQLALDTSGTSYTGTINFEIVGN